MDRNTILGLVLMGVVIFAFSWLNSPSEEELKATAETQTEQKESASVAVVDSLSATELAEIKTIVAQYGNYLVVGIVAVQHTESANRLDIDDDVAVGNGTLGQNANIQRVAVAEYIRATALLHTVFRHAIAAETLRNKAVKSGNDSRVFLRTVDFDVTAHLVEFVFYGIGRHHLYKCRNNLGSLFAHLYTMPRVRLVTQAHQSRNRVIDFVSHISISLLLTPQRY